MTEERIRVHEEGTREYEFWEKAWGLAGYPEHPEGHGHLAWCLMDSCVYAARGCREAAPDPYAGAACVRREWRVHLLGPRPLEALADLEKAVEAALTARRVYEETLAAFRRGDAGLAEVAAARKQLLARADRVRARVATTLKLYGYAFGLEDAGDPGPGARPGDGGVAECLRRLLEALGVESDG